VVGRLADLHADTAHALLTGNPGKTAKKRQPKSFPSHDAIAECPMPKCPVICRGLINRANEPFSLNT